MNSGSLRIVLGGVLAVAGVGVLVTSLGDWIGPTGVGLDADGEPGAEGSVDVTLLDPGSARPRDHAGPGGPAEPEVRNEREAILRDEPLAQVAPDEGPVAPVPYVEGRVVDALGRPRAGVQVHARVNPKPVPSRSTGGRTGLGSVGFEEDYSDWTLDDFLADSSKANGGSPNESFTDQDGNHVIVIPSTTLTDFGRFGSDRQDRLRPESVVTDADGHFEMVDLPSDRTGALIFGHGLYRGRLPEKPLVAGQYFYDLVLVNYPEVESRITLDVVDANGGAPLQALHAELNFEGPHPDGPGGPQPKPISEGMSVEGSHIAFAKVTPGRWSAWVRAEESLPARIEFTVEPSGVDQWFPADLRGVEGVDWSSLHAGAATEGQPATLPQPSVERGLAEKVAERPRRFGQGGNDLWLAHTFRFPRNQDLAGAYLTVRLEGYGGMAENDSLNLEYNGEGWKWGTRISSIPGAEGWDRGSKATLRVDLADLPRDTRGVTNLMHELADGELDVFVQDDTIVHSVDLELIAH